MEKELLKMRLQVKCAHDKKRLFDLDPRKVIESFIEIKCPHCGTLNIIQIANGKIEVAVSRERSDAK